MNKNYWDYYFKKENNNEHNNKINVLVIKPKNKINKLKVGVSLISSLLIFYLMIGKNLSLNKDKSGRSPDSKPLKPPQRTPFPIPATKHIHHPRIESPIFGKVILLTSRLCNYTVSYTPVDPQTKRSAYN